MLSPSASATRSPPMNSRPIRNACARPSGLGCDAYSMRRPSSEPSPSSRLKPSCSCGVVMTRMAADAGQHQRRQRVVHHRLVVDRHELLADGARQRMQPRSRSAGENDALQHQHAMPSTKTRRLANPQRQIFLRACVFSWLCEQTFHRSRVPIARDRSGRPGRRRTSRDARRTTRRSREGRRSNVRAGAQPSSRRIFVASIA